MRARHLFAAALLLPSFPAWAADVYLENFWVPTRPLVAGSPFRMRLSFVNQSPYPTTAGVEAQVYASDDDALDDSDTYLCTLSDPEPLAGGSRLILDQSCHWPVDLDASHLFAALVPRGHGDIVFTFVSPWPPRRVDLEAQSLLTASRLVPGNTYSYNAVLRGLGDAYGRENVVIALSSDPVFSADDAVLVEARALRNYTTWPEWDGAYALGQFTVPADTPLGPAHLILKTVSTPYRDVNASNDLVVHDVEVGQALAGVDLVAEVVGPEFAAPGDRLTLQWTVMNQGATDSNYANVKLVASPDEHVDHRDLVLLEFEQPPLPEGTAATGEVSYTLSATHAVAEHGTRYFLLDIAMPEREELVEVDRTNNLGIWPFEVGTLSSMITDLELGEATVPDTLAHGQAFSVRAAVRNASEFDSTPTKLRLWYSADAQLHDTDHPACSLEVPALAAEQQLTLQLSRCMLPPAAPRGEATLFLVIDDEDALPEVRDDNNQRAWSVQVSTSPQGPAQPSTPDPEQPAAPRTPHPEPAAESPRGCQQAPLPGAFWVLPWAVGLTLRRRARPLRGTRGVVSPPTGE